MSRRACRWPGCSKMVPVYKWGCRRHWYRLPKAIRDRIWANYRQGQETDLRITREYALADREAREWAVRYEAEKATARSLFDARRRWGMTPEHDDEQQTYTEYYIVLSWVEDIQAVRYEAADENPIVALARSPEDRPRRVFNVCGEDPGTAIVQWLVSLGCGVQKANDLANAIGVQIHGTDCDW
ncbi:hypothetical protein [Paludisphaera rhizosphaerae]|uniref:hypothetical protein n=1 Tax=Paludisphaera rhizosphaerae TaxID=2711216 RepID=UPI0013EDC1AC|nr:hypothetical protein [Paludisphaera rhizosphaerae]